MANYNFCFVVIGFGIKPSYATGVVRQLDLNQTYTKLIKPVFDELGIKCQRACDMNITGSIDQVMIKAINESDIVICDITCLNANALWELGVRHALKKKHTILISDFAHLNPAPFDVNHYVIYGYNHSPEGITDEEALRFRGVLKGVVEKLDQNLVKSDSPVYDILDPDNSPLFGNKDAVVMEPFSELIAKAEKAKKAKDWPLAISLFNKAEEYIQKNLAPDSELSFVKCRQALCTYKANSKSLVELGKAMGILDKLNPKETVNAEVLGLSGAINKRIFEIGGGTQYLEDSIYSYDRGFSLLQDYYNGINAAFMLYKKASIQKSAGNSEWEDTKTDADSMRNKVLKVSLALEAAPNFDQRADRIWVYYTIAEAYNYKGDPGRQEEYEKKAEEVAKATNDDFAISAYEDQKAKIEEIKKLLV